VFTSLAAAPQEHCGGAARGRAAARGLLLVPLLAALADDAFASRFVPSGGGDAARDERCSKRDGGGQCQGVSDDESDGASGGERAATLAGLLGVLVDHVAAADVRHYIM
jgi:hypothetical protein